VTLSSLVLWEDVRAAYASSALGLGKPSAKTLASAEVSGEISSVEVRRLI
jgi:hypothetical protein